MLKVKKIKPMFTSLITTMNKYEEDSYDGNIIEADKIKGSLKEYQKVLAIGSLVRDIKVGDLVKINPSRFAVKKFKEDSLNNGVTQVNHIIGYNFDVVEMNDEQCLLLQDRDIDFIIEEYEEVKDTPKPTKKLIVPDTKLILD